MKNDDQGEAILEGCRDPGDKEEAQAGKSDFQKVIDGDIEPEGSQKGWKNLIKGQTEHNLRNIDPEKAREIRRKGAEAINKLHGEKKTARESLEAILTLKVTDEILAGAELPDELAERLKRDNPDATLYDLIQLVAVGRAVGGNMKAYELIRDTHGDKPVDRVDISGEIMTEADRAMIARIGARLDDPSLVIAKDVTPLPGEDQT